MSSARDIVPWVDSPFFEQELASRAGTELQRQIAQDYRRDGYVVIPGAFSEELIDRAAAELDRLFEDEQTRINRRVQDVWEYEGPAKEVAVNDTVLDTLRYLYAREPIPFQTLTFQRGTEQRGHADTIHFSSLPARFMCAVWVAFEDITPDSGALFYYPGSHRLPELAPHDLGFTADTFDYAAYEDQQEALMKATGHEPKQFHAKKGDALLWSSNVVHGGSPILDPNSTRRSQVTHYFFEDCVYYTPMYSDAPAGEYYVRSYLTDIRTRRRPQHSYDGRPVALTALRNGRTRITISPSPINHLTAGLHEITAGFPRTIHRVKGVGRRLLKRRHANRS